jgi:hypothetical protein
MGGRKRSVSTDKMNEWLRLVEMKGKSALEISKVDKGKYDPRTVRKYIDLARQERDMKEIRGQVLRDSLIHHYETLIAFVQQLDQGIATSQLLLTEKNDHKWTALHQHLPRSPIFKMIEQWEQSHKNINDIIESIRRKLDARVAASGFRYRSGAVSEGLDSQGLFSLILRRLELLASTPDKDMLLSELEVKTAPAGQETVTVIIGGWPCAIVPIGQIGRVEEVVKSILTEMSESPEVEEMRKTRETLSTLTEKLREELETIILRGVLPGRCKYCPV